MPFAIYKGEKTMDALVARLFPAHGKSTKAAAKQAASALLKANPQLGNLSTLPAGSILTIPDTAPALEPAEQVAAPAQALSAAANRALGLTSTLAQRLNAIDVQARAAAQTVAALAPAKGAPETPAELPDLSAIVPSGKKTLQANLKSLEANQKARTDLFTSLQQQLVSLGSGQQ